MTALHPVDTELGSVRAATRGEVEAGPNEGARKAAAARALVAQGLESTLGSLRQPSTLVRVGELAMFAALWAFGAAAIVRSMRMDSSLAGLALHGAGIAGVALALHAIALLLHDGVHHTLFRNRAANRVVSVLLGACVFVSFSAYQTMHERHHIFLGDPRDPDDYRNYTRDPRVVWAMHYLRLLFGSFLYLLVIPILIARGGAPRDRRRVGLEYAVLAALYAALWLLVPHPLLVQCWLIPFVPAALMFNIRSLAAHGITDARDPFLASRSIDANPVVAFFFRNENFHLEHHLFPEVPSYNLKKVHRLVFHRFPRAATARSYIAFLVQFVRQSFTLDETPIGIIRRDQSTDARSTVRFP